MAVNFPSDIYSEGQGIFNAMPYVRMIEAKKKAKQEALTKYYDKLKAQINTAGVRQIDLLDEKTGTGILKDIEDWTNYGIQNKDQIARNGAESLQFEEMQRKILNRIDQSKSVKDFQLDVAKAQFDGKIEPDDDDMGVQERVGFSIYDPKHYKESLIDPNYKDNFGTSFSWQDLSPAIPTLTTAEKQKFYQFALGKEEPIGDPTKGKVDKGYLIYDKRFTQDQLLRGADRAAFEVKDAPISQEEKKIRKTYVKAKDDAAWLAKADPIFQQYYGRSIETAKDAAAADFIMTYKDIKKPMREPIKTPSARGGRSRGGGGSTGPTIIDDAYSRLNTYIDDYKTKYNVSTIFFKDIKSSSLATALNDEVKQAKQEGVEIPEGTQLYVYRDKDGNSAIYHTNPDTPDIMAPDDAFRIVYLDEIGFNTTANKKGGVKARAKVLEKAKSKGTTNNNNPLGL